MALSSDSGRGDTRSARPHFARAPENVRRGIAMALVSVLLFSGLNVLVKLLTDDVPVLEVVFARNAFAMLPVGITVALRGGIGSLRTRHPGGHVWRACIGLTAMSLIFWSYDLLPLADAVALSFTAPLFLTALSVPLLGETVGPHRWSAVLIGFVGVLVILRPGVGVVQAGALVALGSALGQALALVTIRQLSRTEPPDTIVFYFTLLASLMSALPLPWLWVTPSPRDFVLMVLMGLSGGVAQLFMTRAYALAPAAVIAPYNYGAIVCAVMAGWLVWGDVPAIHAMLGAAIVMASGLYILHRETRRRPGEDAR
jgi:drug/metabolite transporter (DMT)-like permease